MFGANISDFIEFMMYIDTLLHLFLTVFLGSSFEGIAYLKGYKLDTLERDFMTLYDFVKVK